MGRPTKSSFVLMHRLTVEVLEARCRARGIRIGPARRVIAHVVAAADGHFDFDWVFDRARKIAPRMSRGTIYLSLQRFQVAGLIQVSNAV